VDHHPELTIFVDDEKVVVTTNTLTLREILDGAGLDSTEHLLFEERGVDEVRYSNPDDQVPVRDGLRLRTRRKIHIHVNGRERTVDHDVLTFDEVVHLAPNLPPLTEGTEYRVTFSGAVLPKEGDLIQGETVQVKDGTEFRVSPTNRS
jgi:hypothetical protein